MEIKDYLTIVVPSIVTILGFIVTFILNKKEYSQSILRYKSKKQISDLYGLQKDIFRLVDMILPILAHDYKKVNDYTVLRDKIYSNVICVGTEDAVKIIVYIKNLIQSGVDDNIEVSNAKVIAGYILLAMQIKYDTTGIKTSPDVWYIGRFTTQKMLAIGDFYDDSVKTINDIVSDLNLKPFLRIEH